MTPRIVSVAEEAWFLFWPAVGFSFLVAGRSLVFLLSPGVRAHGEQEAHRGRRGEYSEPISHVSSPHSLKRYSFLRAVPEREDIPAPGYQSRQLRCRDQDSQPDSRMI